MAAASNANTPAQPIVIPPPTAEEEDQITLARITIDERPLRRIIKRFHNYTSLSHTPIVPVLPGNVPTPASIEDAREGFLVELAQFQLLMKKSAMICEAEARQVEEYQRERQALDEEHGTLKLQIEELKVALEHAQMLRRRKIEYDAVAEKVNTLPSREELETSIRSLENDMAAIRAEHDTQNRTIQGHKSALDTIISDLSSLRFMGKEPETTPTPSNPQSLRATPAPEPDVESSLTSFSAEEVEEDKDDGLLPETVSESQTVMSEGMIEEEDDIEMGEVEEDPRDKNKKKSQREEEMEEGEATDASSELSEPPDD
ncbi:Tho complex subunit 7-domain-containing protein [Pholiota molesta]|nr:Tho complex subunit 7-domain-containing protein [Pholiota molesta]